MAAAFQTGAFQPAFQVDDLVTVPDVVGSSQAAGTTTLEAAGFVVSVQSESSQTVPVGDIISQSPAGGTDAPDGSTVVIYISTGPSAGNLIILQRRRVRR